MDKYLMMLFVSLEQEKAIRQFFRDQGWKYAKPDLQNTTDRLGPLDGSWVVESDENILNRTVEPSAATRKRTAIKIEPTHLINNKKPKLSPYKSGNQQQEALLENFEADADSTDDGDDDDDFVDQPLITENPVEANTGISGVQTVTVKADGTVCTSADTALTLRINVSKGMSGEAGDSNKLVYVAKQAHKMSSENTDGPANISYNVMGKRYQESQVERNAAAVYQSAAERCLQDGIDGAEVDGKVLHGCEAKTSKILASTDLTCDMCCKTFSRKSALMRHRKLHQPGFIRCTPCNVYFDNEGQLQEHLEKFHSEPIRCQYCNAEFCRKSVLQTHIVSAS